MTSLMVRLWFAFALVSAWLVACASSEGRAAPTMWSPTPSPAPYSTATMLAVAESEPTDTPTRAAPSPAPVLTRLAPTEAATAAISTAREPLELDAPPTTRPRPAITPTPYRLPTLLLAEPIAGSVQPRAVYRGDGTRPRVALTFDTGQGLPTVIQILDTLKAANVRATFFLMGTWASKNGGVVKRIAADGHELANHSYSHPNFNNIPDDQINAQVLWTEQIVQRLTGCSTRPFLRPPFGAANAHTQEVLARAGYYDVMWSAHGGDWLPGATAESVRQTVARNAGRGTILILHSSAPQTAAALPAILSDLQARGLEVVTLGELLRGDPRYRIPPPCAPPRALLE